VNRFAVFLNPSDIAVLDVDGVVLGMAVYMADVLTTTLLRSSGGDGRAADVRVSRAE
jgi:hypothetical protein